MALLLQSSAVTGTLVILAIVAILAAVGGFFYMKYRKGSIELQLSRHNYSPGDMLDGTLVVTPRQDLLVDTQIPLIGLIVQHHGDTIGDFHKELCKVFHGFLFHHGKIRPAAEGNFGGLQSSFQLDADDAHSNGNAAVHILQDHRQHSLDLVQRHPFVLAGLPAGDHGSDAGVDDKIDLAAHAVQVDGQVIIVKWRGK